MCGPQEEFQLNGKKALSSHSTRAKDRSLTCIIWNFLPEDIVDFSSLTTFKRTIKSVNFNAFLNVSEMQIKCI